LRVFDIIFLVLPPVFIRRGGKLCILSVFADITERKQAEEAMSGFSRRLIEAQEAERTRIGRELHDDSPI